jgi:predicted transposase/invertase (TIGR01784 family)
MSLKNPKIDLVFKKLFGSEENKDILISLINAILPESQQIRAIQLKNPYNLSDYAEGKLSILDIKAEDEKGILYDIEMQIRGSVFYGKRTLYYWAKIFGSQLDSLTEEDIENKIKKGKAYSDLNKCIVISLIDFNFFADRRYHRCFTLKDRETGEPHPDLDYLDLYFVEFQKFEPQLETVGTLLDKWIKFLNYAYLYPPEKFPTELTEVEPIRKANEKLRVMYFNETEKNLYEAQQKFYLDEISRLQEAVEEAVEAAIEKTKQEAERERLAAIEKTRQEAEKEKQIAIAKSLLQTELSVEAIAKHTGLTATQVRELREKDV